MTNNSKLVVKDNALIDASFNLSLIEQRIMLLAIVEARECLTLTPDMPIEVSVSNYIHQFKVDSNNAYGLIRDAAKTLKRREFSYLDRYKGHMALTTANWVNKVSYVDSNGLIVLYLSTEVISLISRLSEQFTRYYIEQVSDFKSKYSIRLYELLIKWLNMETTEKFNIFDLRSKLGLSVDEYSTMSNFKSNVLDKAIKEINTYTDITVEYSQFKSGRVITDIQFKVKTKNKSTKSKIKKTFDHAKFQELTDAQINMFGNKLAQLPELAYLAEGNESYEALASRIKNMLRDESKQKKFIPHLKSLGFSAK
ncbi:replication initiation protein RepM [Acinetobacter nectaris]|uniref:replication initiation protein RepM n=1 Tax=Acinetobacter nectaris TaxID=1219382 RepID=UPI001EFFE38B|nr:replication initiation protein RepM [Acinetobacter nectaris]MCF9000213.1 replication initiation protein [Acinetobacter nectaris]MCF9028448.1 replication initiation protein [Acinetobacter nectaris]